MGFNHIDYQRINYFNRQLNYKAKENILRL